MISFDLILAFAVSFTLLVIAMTVHEFAHSLVAYKLGDSTARLSGRLTLNPLPHIDLFWTLILPLAVFLSTPQHSIFGAAKPVPVNYWALKNPKRDMIWIGLAGPLANFILAFIISGIFRFVAPQSINAYLLFNLLEINVVLGIFNLIPIPPLDGSNILIGLLPAKLSQQYVKFGRYGFIILVLLIWFGGINQWIWSLVGAVIKLMGVGV